MRIGGWLLGASGAMAIGCSSPEERAGAAAEQYAALGLGVEDAEKQWQAACSEDKAAKPLAEARLEREELLKRYPDLAAGLEGYVDDHARKLESVTLDPGGQAATAQLAVLGGDEPQTMKVEMLLEDGDWCVVTGWAEQARREAERKRLQGVADGALGLISEAATLLDEWQIEEAKAKIDEARAALDGIPEESGVGRVERIDLRSAERLYDLKADGWIGGRWRTSSEVDPMTDKVNTAAHLESVDTMADSIGSPKRATLLLRCRKGKFDAYVVTPAMLDAHWEYDTVTGQYRIGSSKPAKLKGTRSSDYKAVFLRDPKAWAARLREHDGEKLVLELPVYNKLPQTVSFDLTAASAAVEATLAGCM